LCRSCVRSCRCYHNAFYTFFTGTATTEIYTLSLHDALPISFAQKNELKAAEKAIKSGNYADAKAAINSAEALIASADDKTKAQLDRKSTRLNSSHVKISYAVFCLKKKKKKKKKR